MFGGPCWLLCPQLGTLLIVSAAVQGEGAAPDYVLQEIDDLIWENQAGNLAGSTKAGGYNLCSRDGLLEQHQCHACIPIALRDLQASHAAQLYPYLSYGIASL
jgi:hypothetical protein